MNDEHKIFKLYLEMAAKKNQPQMIERADGTKHGILHDKLHREDGAAYEHANGTKAWYLHGKRHREDGAAYEGADGTKQWYLHDKRHREDGAAVEWADGTKAWYCMTWYYENAEAWAEALLKSRNEKHDEQSIDAFLKAILKKDIEEAL
jgi:hypothetical protein